MLGEAYAVMACVLWAGLRKSPLSRVRKRTLESGGLELQYEFHRFDVFVFQPPVVRLNYGRGATGAYCIAQLGEIVVGSVKIWAGDGVRLRDKLSSQYSLLDEVVDCLDVRQVGGDLNTCRSSGGGVHVRAGCGQGFALPCCDRMC